MTECSRRRAIHDWVAGVLGKADLHFEAASQDASFRRYLRVIDERCSYVIMDAPPERSDPHAFIDVQSRLRAAGLNVPQILAVDVQRGFFVLSDLGRARYLDVLNDSNADELYRASIDALVCMQTRVPDTDLPRYDESLLRTELALFDEWLLQRHLGIRLESDDRDALQTCFDFLVTSCLDQPQVFVHRDYHSRNLMVTERDRPGVLDFQDAVQGPIAYDLVSLLRDVYIAWPKERVEAWIGHYLVKMRAAHREIAVEQLHRWCDLSGAQRHIKIAGLFCRLHYRDAKPHYLADIPLALEYLAAVASAYRELDGLSALLGRLEVRSRLRLRNARVLDDVTGANPSCEQ